ncbi:conjugal transfer protein TraF [Devosia limi DSM 17137]|uniref:Conjugal transfer protein TraF n=1 Tax=Devosia limi DSM 17137 TaxID=1121477 RepID=A0A0F5LSK3_9HYPH|nr:conjugative transfer signal peptidase TraF [Devosia limi]KKB84627.1 conjugal transfer protein TraF [Devosia limi DSM 17137]SHF56579.1 conjugative transfer signal peptidase TraF [Devosia limi DSM 17137]
MTCRAPAVAIIGIGATIMIGLVAGGHLGGLRINLTPSYPLGLWRIAPLERPAGVGDLIFICPPDTPTFRQAAERGYLRRGLCPGWLSPLIKTIVATPGQHIAVDVAVTIDGALLAASALRPTDAEGRVLVAHDGGAVPIGHLFVHSDFAGSYDSRYFGPIPVAGLLGLAHPVLTYAR